MAPTEKQRAALAAARAARKAKLEAKNKRAAAKVVVRHTVPAPAPAPDGAVTAPGDAPETAPATAADTAGAGASPPVARAADTAADDELGRTGEDAGDDDDGRDGAAPVAPAGPGEEESDEQRKARYRALARYIGRNAPRHYQVHRVITARALRMGVARVVGVDLGAMQVMTGRTTPSGDCVPVVCTADKAVCLSIAELSAWAFGNSLDHPGIPAIMGLAAVASAILEAKMMELRARKTGRHVDPPAETHPDKDFHDVDEATLAKLEQAARDAA